MELNASSVGFSALNNTSNYFRSSKNETSNNETSALERSPITDSVSFQSKQRDKNVMVVSLKGADELKYDLEYNKVSKWRNDTNVVGDDVDVNFKHGLGGSKLTGNAYSHNINLEYDCKGLDPNKMTIKGKIDNKNVDLKYNILGNNVNIEGDISEIDENTLNMMNMFAKDYAVIANEQLMLAALMIVA